MLREHLSQANLLLLHPSPKLKKNSWLPTKSCYNEVIQRVQKRLLSDKVNSGIKGELVSQTR